MIESVRDVSDRIHAELALRQTMETLEKKNQELLVLDKMKDGLIRDVSHELKTPVAKIKMQLELLKMATKHPEKHLDIQRIFNALELSIQRQESVIKNMLDLSRLESGARQYKSELFALDQLLEEVISEYQLMLEDSGIVLEKFLEKLTINSDKEMLFHAFSNLINNAIKYRRNGQEGKLKVTLAGEQDKVLITIEDNGIGMTAAERERAFERFYQAAASSEGSGVGLTIVKMIIEGLKGRIALVSAGRDQGTTVTVELSVRAS